MQMSYRYQYNDSGYHQDMVSPSTPGGTSSPSTPVNNPWDFDATTSASNPAQQPQDPTSMTSLSTLHPAEFSPQELFSTSVGPAVSSPTVIQLEERIPVVPSQYHRSRIRAASGESTPRTHVQRDAASANIEQPAGTSTGTAPSSGLVRSSLTNVHAERTRAHPYRRPHSAGAGGGAPRASSVGASKGMRSVSDQARTSPVTGDNSCGLTRMRYATPCFLPPFYTAAHVSSDHRAGMQPPICCARHCAWSANIAIEGVLNPHRYSFQRRHEHNDCYARVARR
jgi:hypothetical protein